MCVLLSSFVLVCALVYAYYISFDVFADFDVCICNAAKIASCNSAIFSSLFESSFRTWHRNNLERVANKDRNARLYSKLMLSRRHNISVRERKGEGKARIKYLSSSWAIFFWVTVCKWCTVSFHEMFKMNKTSDSVKYQVIGQYISRFLS